MKRATNEVSDDSSRCKHLLPMTVSSPDHHQSPLTRKGHKTSEENSVVVKFNADISEIWLSMMLFYSKKQYLFS